MSTTDTERDERLREAREAATRARTQNPPLGIETWLITLDDEVARLDAVVTAVRDLHRPGAGGYCVECSSLSGEDDAALHPCPTRRAVDGGAS